MRMLSTRVVILISMIALCNIAYAKKSTSYSAKLCQESGYTCYKVKKGDTWAKLFPDKEEREVVKR